MIFIGDSGVGKTSIITRVTTGVFDPSPPSTIGAGVRPISFKSGGQAYKFHLWDTAGQDIYRSIVPLYFRQATCAVAVFSMNDGNSFTDIPDWIKLLREHAYHEVPVVVVGNKMDLESHEFEIPEIKRWAEANHFPLFFTSAVSGRGINELFEHICLYISSNQGPDIQSALADHMDQGSEKGCCK